MKTLYFVFFKTMNLVDIDATLRVSLWLENTSFLIPCEFEEVRQESNFYSIKVKALDPDQYLSNQFIEKKFFFGHPGKIIGYGILKEVGK
jgi:hypothetical protein